jgi:hypothetical protein
MHHYVMNKLLSWISLIIGLLSLALSITLAVFLFKREEPSTSTPAQNIVSTTPANSTNTAPVTNTTKPVAPIVTTTEFCSEDLGFGFEYPSVLGEPEVTESALTDLGLQWGSNDSNIPENETGIRTLSFTVNSQGGIGLEPFKDIDEQVITTGVLTGTSRLMQWDPSFGGGSEATTPELDFLLMIKVSDSTNDYGFMVQYSERPTPAQEQVLTDLLNSWTTSCTE